MSADTTQLQAEIQRLNVIITVLVEKNQQLERELSVVKSNMSLPTFYNILSKIEQAPNEYDNIPHKSEQGIIDRSNILSKELRGIEKDENIATLFQQGIEQEGVILPQFQQRIEDIDIVPGNKLQRIEAPVGNLSSMAIIILRQQLAISLTIEDVYKALKQEEMPKVSGDGVRRVAKVLLLLCREDRVSYAAIRKQVAMTDSGINKLIMAMKRRGLIHRSGFQKFDLTTKALDLLKKAKALSQSSAVS